MELTSSAKKQLRGLAHSLEAIVRVGKDGVTPGLLAEINQALLDHELIKVKFLDHKEARRELTQTIAEASGAGVAGVVGHVAILYRPHPEAEKRKIRVS